MARKIKLADILGLISDKMRMRNGNIKVDYFAKEEALTGVIMSFPESYRRFDEEAWVKISKILEDVADNLFWIDSKEAFYKGVVKLGVNPSHSRVRDLKLIREVLVKTSDEIDALPIF